MKQLGIRVGGELAKIKVTHWWPGREWAGPSPIPAFYIKQAERQGSKYLTMAEVVMPSPHDWVELAFCNPVDTPSRKRGRQIAIGRLAKRLTLRGYEVVEYEPQ